MRYGPDLSDEMWFVTNGPVVSSGGYEPKESVIVPFSDPGRAAGLPKGRVNRFLASPVVEALQETVRACRC